MKRRARILVVSVSLAFSLVLVAQAGAPGPTSYKAPKYGGPH